VILNPQVYLVLCTSSPL